MTPSGVTERINTSEEYNTSFFEIENVINIYLRKADIRHTD
jgi:hypothetical protein